jgi:hypothetical protein
MPYAGQCGIQSRRSNVKRRRLRKSTEMGCETAATPSAVSRVERWTDFKAMTDGLKVKIL